MALACQLSKIKKNEEIREMTEVPLYDYTGRLQRPDKPVPLQAGGAKCKESEDVDESCRGVAS
jgi:hypothetical protein